MNVGCYGECTEQCTVFLAVTRLEAPSLFDCLHPQGDLRGYG